MDQSEPEKLESEEKPFSELPVEAPPQKETPAAAAPVIPPKKTESRPRRFFRLTIRWVAGFLIVFLLGVLAMEFVFYLPHTQQLTQQVEQANTAREQAIQNSKNLQTQLDGLAPVATQNATLQASLTKSQLHVTILSAEANINSAQISFLNNKSADARLVLNKAQTTLKSLQTMLPPDQQTVAVDMQNRLTLVLSELDSNKFAAQSDLTVLSTSLLQLENTLFASP